jgi:hypothetical protein
MNKKSIVLAVIIGTALGMFVIRPLSMSLHVFDEHAGGVSWLDYLGSAYSEVLSLKDFGLTLLSIFSGILTVVLFVMIKSRKRN